jgi:hypothetical protein
MSATLAVATVLACVLACISFLAGTTYTDHARNRAYRQLAEERRELNAMLVYSLDSYGTPSTGSCPYAPFHACASRQAPLPQPYDHDLADD